MNRLALKEEFAVKKDNCVQWVEKLGKVKNEDGWTWNGKFKVLDCTVPSHFQIPDHLFDIVNIITFIQPEPKRLPLFFGTTMGTFPSLNRIDHELWQFCATTEEKALYKSFWEMHKAEGLDRFPKVVIDHFSTRPWILATLGKSLSGLVGGVSIKKQTRPSDFWVSRLEIELLLRFPNWDR